jgi:hypothetical protein
VININYANLLNSGGTFASAGFDKVDVNLVGNASAGGETFYFGGTTAIANADSFETFTLTAGLVHGGGETIDFGNVTTQVLGGNDITLLGGAIIVNPPTAQFSLTGMLDIAGIDNVIIGVTNASVIVSTTTGTFDMTSPDDIDNPGALWVAQQSVGVAVTSAGSTLQGTLGAGALPGTGTDLLADPAGHSSFFGDGGHDIINIGGGNNDVFFGEYLLNDVVHTQAVDAGNNAELGFWGATSNGQALFGGAGSIFGGSNFGGTQADMTTINGFTIGSGGDNLTFHVAAFGGGLTDPGDGLTIGTNTTAAGDGFAVGFAGETITTGVVRVVLDEISQFTDANALAHSMVTGTVGDFKLGFNLAHNASADFLVAYEVQGGTAINIAEVHVFNSGGTTNNTANMDVYAQDLVHLAGINFGLTALGVNLGEIHFS